MNLEVKLKTMVRRTPWLKRLIKKAFRIDAVNSQVASLENKIIYSYIERLNERILQLEEIAGVHSRKILDFGDSTPASFSLVKSQAATTEQMLEPEYRIWCERLNDAPKLHRKQWEYIYILKALDQFQKLAPGMTGLGFGVGKDPIVAYMVKQGCSILATDLDPTAAHTAGWVDTNQYSKKLLDLNDRGICSDHELKKKVTLRNVNMNEIPAELSKGEFDFTWSACAFEHLGSIEQGLQFVENSIKCLKPGGIAVHTTELNVSSNETTIEKGHTVIFRKRDFEELARRLREKGYEIEMNFHMGTQPQDKFYDVPPYSEFNHLKLELDRFITTSYGIIVRNPL